MNAKFLRKDWIWCMSSISEVSEWGVERRGVITRNLVGATHVLWVMILWKEILFCFLLGSQRKEWKHWTIFWLHSSLSFPSLLIEMSLANIRKCVAKFCLAPGHQWHWLEKDFGCWLCYARYIHLQDVYARHTHTHTQNRVPVKTIV